MSLDSQTAAEEFAGMETLQTQTIHKTTKAAVCAGLSVLGV
jgi:hypothetical protein